MNSILHKVYTVGVWNYQQIYLEQLENFWGIESATNAAFYSPPIYIYI